MVGCEHRFRPMSGKRPHSSLKAGSRRNQSKSFSAAGAPPAGGASPELQAARAATATRAIRTVLLDLIFPFSRYLWAEHPPPFGTTFDQLPKQDCTVGPRVGGEMPSTC